MQGSNVYQLKDRSRAVQRKACSHPSVTEWYCRWETFPARWMVQRWTRGVRFCSACGALEDQTTFVHEKLVPRLTFRRIVDPQALQRIDCRHLVLLEIALEADLKRFHDRASTTVASSKKQSKAA